MSSLNNILCNLNLGLRQSLFEQDERQRIEALGGCVVYFGAWRVNGSLSVSRAIGDAEHKPYISGEPDVEEFIFEGTYAPQL